MLDELAKEFEASGYDLRWLLTSIAKSKTYQLSADFPGEWKPAYERHFARRKLKRLSAQQVFDAVADVTGVYRDIPIRYDDAKVPTIMQTRSPMDLDRGGHKDLNEAAMEFGMCDRYTRGPSLEPSMGQAAILLNDDVIRDWVRVTNDGRLAKLLRAEPPTPNVEIVDELYLAALSRPPSQSDRETAAAHLADYRDAGAEDGALVNTLEFLSY